MALIDPTVVRYIRFDSCNVFISTLELSAAPQFYLHTHSRVLVRNINVTSHTKMFLMVCRFRTDSHVHAMH